MKKNNPLNRIIISLFLLCTFTSCIEYHPYDTNLSGEVGLNEKNIALIEAQCHQKPTIRFAVVSDSQRCYDELQASVESINRRDDIDFVIHAGDISDFGMRTEFEEQRDILQKLNVPFVCLVGNHDCLATGEIIFRKMFGEFNFDFTAGDVHFVCVNTNALEFDYDEPVPDFAFLEQQLSDTASKASKSVVVMHAQPYSDQFNNNIANIFQAYITRLPALQFCIHGHGHKFHVEDIFDDGILYYQCYSSGERAYMIFTIDENGYSYEEVFI